jgi:uncharacterized membrane protein YfcA
VSVETVAIAAAVLFAGALLHSAIGFGIGLVVIPLLVAAGFSLPSAVATLIGAGFVTSALSLFGAREHMQPRLSLGVGVAQAIGIPLGVAAMATLSEAPPGAVRRAVGIVVAGLVTARLVIRPRPRESVHAAWAGLAGTAGGFLAGLVGMGGPPLVFYALASAWTKDRFRAFLWTQFILGAPIVAGVLAWRFGTDVLQYIGVGAAMTPLIWIATRIGLAITRRWQAKQLAIAAVLVLYGIAVMAIVAP